MTRTANERTPLNVEYFSPSPTREPCCKPTVPTTLAVALYALAGISITTLACSFLQREVVPLTSQADCHLPFPQIRRLANGAILSSAAGVVAVISLYSLRKRVVPAMLMTSCFLLTNVVNTILSGVQGSMLPADPAYCPSFTSSFRGFNNLNSALSILASATSLVVIGLLYQKQRT